MWRSIIVIKPEAIWKFTPEVEGYYFRLRHIDSPMVPKGWLAQAEAIPNTDFHQIFVPQRINGLVQFEILELVKPTIFAGRKLAFRQETKTPNEWLIEVEVSDYMPSYSLDDPAPTNQLSASAKNVTTVAVGTTPTKVLAANPLRKAVLFVSPDKVKTVYLDTDNVVSSASAIESLTPSRPQCIPSIDWTGDWFGISSAGSVTITIEEYF